VSFEPLLCFYDECNYIIHSVEEDSNEEVPALIKAMLQNDGEDEFCNDTKYQKRSLKVIEEITFIGLFKYLSMSCSLTSHDYYTACP
jgi:hypothetical protein